MMIVLINGKSRKKPFISSIRTKVYELNYIVRYHCKLKCCAHHAAMIG